MGTNAASASTGVAARPARSAGRFGRRALLKGAAAAGLGLGAAALLNPGAGSLAGLTTLPAVSAGNPEKLFFFYRDSDAFAAVGTIDGGAFSTLRAWNPYTFGTGWTHIVGRPLSGGELLFYNYNSRWAARGNLRWDTFQQTSAASGLPFWTHVLATPRTTKPSPYFFYNNANRSGAFGYDPIARAYDPYSFGYWTRVAVVQTPEYALNHQILFYRGSTGEGAIGVDPTLTNYGPGAFYPGWSHIVATCNRSYPVGHDILFYDQNTGYYALARLTPDHRAIATYRTGYLSAWTHIVAAGADGFLFYNKHNGNGAIAKVVNNTLVDTRSYPGGFATGWTHIAEVDRATFTG